MSDVILVINNSSWFGKRDYRTWLPSVPIIATLLKNEVDFSVLDANVGKLSLAETRDKITESKAKVVLISALSIDYQIQYHAIAKIAKEALPNCKTLMGGVYASTLPAQVLVDHNIDFVMIGHAENRLLRIVKAMLNDSKSLLREPGIGFLENGEPLIVPFSGYLYQNETVVRPDYGMIDIEGYFALQQNSSAQNYSTECRAKRSVNIITSYGCPNNCSFCANKSLSGRKVSYRPVADVLDEIDFFTQNYGVEHISFMDDNIVSDRTRAIHLFSEIQKRNYNLEIQIGNLSVWNLTEDIVRLLSSIGCTRIGISVESGSQRVIDEIIHKPIELETIPGLIKMLQQHEIMTIADFIIGLPGETWKEIRSTFSFAHDIEADLCNFNIAVPYPDTDMYRHMKSSGLLPEYFAFDENFYVNGLVSTNEFSPSELKVACALEWDRINLGSMQRSERAGRVLRLSQEELSAHAKQMRKNAIRFVKNHG